MASTVNTFDTRHSDMIHDAQLDYYGRRLATCSSDRMIKLFNVSNDEHVHTVDLRGHDGPVWRVSWAHPKFGNLLASCSYDRMVFIWEETSENNWSRIQQFTQHNSSVNSVAWAPHELGLILATASSDGSFAILERHEDGSWECSHRDQAAHNIGCNAVSWAPAILTSSLADGSGEIQYSRRIVTGGCDNLVNVWSFENGIWGKESLHGHEDWVRDVAWAPNTGIPRDTIASCGQDGRVIVWTRDASSPSWTATLVTKLDAVAWRVSWSIAGNILAVSSGDNRVGLWKEFSEGKWEKISSVDEVDAQSPEGGNASSSTPNALSPSDSTSGTLPPSSSSAIPL